MCNNETHLFVKVTAIYGLQPVDEQIVAWVGTDEADLPTSSGGIRNGAFPYKSNPLDGNSWGFIVELSSLKSLDGNPVDCNALIFIYVHANVFDENGAGQTAYSLESLLEMVKKFVRLLLLMGLTYYLKGSIPNNFNSTIME